MNAEEINNLNEICKLNDFEWIYDEDGPFWSYLKEFTDPDDNGDFEYEMINYYKCKGDDYYTCEIHCRRNTNFAANIITLVNPTIDEVIEAMKLIKFEKTLIV